MMRIHPPISVQHTSYNPGILIAWNADRGLTLQEAEEVKYLIAKAPEMYQLLTDYSAQYSGDYDPFIGRIRALLRQIGPT